MAEDTGFEFLEKRFAEIVKAPPFSEWTREKLYDNLDVVWSLLEKDYFAMFRTGGNIQQSWNNNNGYFYEKVVLDYLNQELEGKNVRVYNMGKRKYHKMPLSVRNQISDSLKVNVTRKCINQRYQLKTEIELDLLAIDMATNRIISSITCKTRYRERVYQPLYASLHLSNVRAIFVTMDRDRNLKTCEKPSDKRALLEHYMDGVFVNSSDKRLGFCAMIHPFKEIVPKILEWKLLNGSHH